MISKDVLWKGIIEDLFEYFIRYFLPALAKEIDFSKTIEFLDKELDALMPENTRKNRHADKLIKFYTKAGKPKYILLHIEVQGYKDLNFAERMFEYYYRIRDRYKYPVCAFALYTDENIAFHPTQYQEGYDQTRVLYEYPIFELCNKTEQELEQQGNPFSIVMKVAHKALQKQNISDDQQLIWKTELVREFWKEGYSKAITRNILNFIRYYVVISLPQNKVKLDAEIQQIIKKRTHMGIEEAILTAVKEDATNEGLQQGMQQGKKEDVFGMFAEGLSMEAIVRITKLPLATIQTWQTEWQASQK
jgi:predicted transposase/invertase (TIGR01784 family)